MKEGSNEAKKQRDIPYRTVEGSTVAGRWIGDEEGIHRLQASERQREELRSCEKIR